jgi:hypothetical protein
MLDALERKWGRNQKRERKQGDGAVFNIDRG